MEVIFRDITFYLASAVEAAAALVIALATLEAVVGALGLSVTRPALPEERKVALRLRLGRWLALALEFLLAADILRTAIAPTWDDIGKLAAIAALRTALNFFLAREVRDEAQTASSRAQVHGE
jgi:uncharacterized membrane protein